MTDSETESDDEDKQQAKSPFQEMTEHHAAALSTLVSPIQAHYVEVNDEIVPRNVAVTVSSMLPDEQSLTDLADATVDVESITSELDMSESTIMAAEMAAEAYEPLDDLDVSYENSQSIDEQEGETIDTEELEEAIDSFYEIGIEAGFILPCDGCEKRVLRENSHEFATTEDGEILCGSCRTTGRSIQ